MKAAFFYPQFPLFRPFYTQFKKVMPGKRHEPLNIPQRRIHPSPLINSPYDRLICRINVRREIMDDREKAVEKVRKLMSLAESAGNENEAANAFSKARIFMKKYHLELSDIYSAEPSPPPLSPRRKAPPRPLTPEERHREMTQLKQQEEQRLREFQKVVEQQQQRKRQREREQQALRAFERQQAELRVQQQAAPPVTPPQEPVPLPDKQPPPQPENHISGQPRESAEPVSRPLIAGFLAALTRKQHIPSYIIAVIIIVFILYIFFFQS